jgi:hypothetical protein
LPPTDPSRIGDLLRRHAAPLTFLPNARTEQPQPRIVRTAISHFHTCNESEDGHDP